MTRNFHLSFDSITWFLLCHWPKYLAQYILLPPRPPEVSPAHAGSRSSERRRPPPSELCLLVLRTLSASSENFGRGFWELWSWVLRTCVFLLLCGFYVYLQYCPQVLRTWSDTSENLVRYFWELGPILLRTLGRTSENLVRYFWELWFPPHRASKKSCSGTNCARQTAGQFHALFVE